MEIALATKRKLGFVQGTVARPHDDQVKVERWDTCNNMIIAWLQNSVFESIGKSVLFLDSTREIWLQLEQRFSLSNGSRKYRINKEIYEVKQNHGPVSECYTKLRCLWEELEDMSQLPKITVMTEEITMFLQAWTKQREEQKLFQFLNGLDDKFGPQRSQLLLMTPLPTVESACALIQQEESQKELLEFSHQEVETIALYGKSKGGRPICTQCGLKGYAKEKCWTVIGYPPWHPKAKKFPQKKTEKQHYKVIPKGAFKGKLTANAESHRQQSSEEMPFLTQKEIE